MNRKKRILVMEALDNTIGHKRFVMRTIECLSEIADVTVASLPNWFPTLPDHVSVEEYVVTGEYKKPQITSLVRSLKHLRKAIELDRKHHFDRIFFTSYHTVAFYLAKIFLKDFDKRVFITHHVNIDDLNRSKIKTFFFKRFAKQVNHFVFEPFIRDHLVDQYAISPQKIFILPHPQNKYEYQENGNQYDCLGISSSNDEEWIKEIIEKEKTDGIFRNNGITVLLRSKVSEFDNGFLKVIKGHFTDDEYYGLYTNATSIILLFPESFRYRMSGSIIDALSNRKNALLSDIPLFRDYEKRYPNVCRVGVAPDQVVAAICEYKNAAETQQQNDDWNRFDAAHSKNNIVSSLAEAFQIAAEKQ